jgi:hypothetical protein
VHRKICQVFVRAMLRFGDAEDSGALPNVKEGVKRAKGEIPLELKVRLRRSKVKNSLRRPQDLVRLVEGESSSLSAPTGCCDLQPR